MKKKNLPDCLSFILHSDHLHATKKQTGFNSQTKRETAETEGERDCV